jgi:homoserine kinase
VIEVRVPCSTSNLGAGFDCIGLAFRRYLTVRYRADNAALNVTRTGTLEHLTEVCDADAVVIAMRSVLSPSVSLTGSLMMDSDIPVGRGLGSSAAATVAGIILGYILRAGDGTVSRDAAFDIDGATRMRALARATDIEGHPDNSAPSLFGGLIGVARAADSSLNAFRLPLSSAVGFVFAAPNVLVSTAAARAALPADVPHPLAVRMLGRTASLVRGLDAGDPDLIRIGLTDELHVPHRLPLIPGASDAFDAAVGAGAWGATISGSGSGLIALCPLDVRADVATAMSAAIASAGSPGVAVEMEVDMDGVLVRALPD